MVAFILGEIMNIYMKEALKEAEKAKLKDEVPIGAVLVSDGKIIARAHNMRESKQVSTSHAEILVIEKGCKKLHTWRLENCELYVTLEPCPMCAGAILQSRIKKVIYGAKDPKGGSIESCMKMYDVKGYNHYPETEYIETLECSQILKDFFREKRMK